jgi:hypothetical protein
MFELLLEAIDPGFSVAVETTLACAALVVAFCGPWERRVPGARLRRARV